MTLPANSSVTAQSVPGLDPTAARRWRERIPLQSPWLHEEIGRRMAERLPWIKQQPQVWLDWGPMQGGVQVHQQVAALYPQAQQWLAGPGAAAAAEHIRRASPKSWNPLRWLAAGATIHTRETEFADLLWANMALHQEASPPQCLLHWLRCLKVNGFLMFSALGPDSLRELRAVYARHGWPMPTHPYTDMHDLGDMLVEAGYAEPVMDMERMTLAYPNAARLLQDLRAWGRNFNRERFPALRGRHWLRALEQALEAELPHDAQGQLLLSFEVVYGHAVKPAPRVKMSSSSQVPLEQMRAMLRQGKV